MPSQRGWGHSAKRCSLPRAGPTLLLSNLPPGLAHRCRSHQGQLHCTAQARYRATAGEGTGLALRTGSSYYCRWWVGGHCPHTHAASGQRAGSPASPPPGVSFAMLSRQGAGPTFWSVAADEDGASSLRLTILWAVFPTARGNNEIKGGEVTSPWGWFTHALATRVSFIVLPG